MSNQFVTKLICHLTLGLMLLSGSSARSLAGGLERGGTWAKGTIVNTTANTWWKNGRWESDMGPLTSFEGGIACDQRARELGNPRKFREGDYAVWFVAPSDMTNQLGLKRCTPNVFGGEPTCSENWDFCGRKLRLTCKEGHPGCAQPGTPSLLAQINKGEGPRNNYIPEFYRQATQQLTGLEPTTPRSIVLYITDFCPHNHSQNSPFGHCQGPQMDVSASAFLLMGKQDNQGYIDGNLEYQVELLDENDPSPAGPEWGSKAPYPYCQANGGQGYGDQWWSEYGKLAKDKADYSLESICIVKSR